MRAYLIPAILFAGAIASRLFARTIVGHHAADFAQPLAVATTWGRDGLVLWAILAATIALAGYVWYTCIESPPPLHITLVASALALAASLCWLPVFSSDVYAYAAYGEMARAGLNPYAHHPQLRDAIVRAAEWQWSGSLPICVYGDAFVAFARAIVTATHGFGLTAVLFAFRLCACGALLACAAIVRGRAAFFIACNPLVVYACGEGHNDVLMILVVFAGFALAARRPLAGVALASAAAAIKAPALAAGWAYLAVKLVQRERALPLVTGVTLGTVVALAASARLIAALASRGAHHGPYVAFASVQSLTPILAAALAVIVLLRARTFDSAYDRALVCALALWLAIPNPYAWYALWILAPAAFARDRRLIAAAGAIAGTTLLRYLPDAVGTPGALATLACGGLAAAAYATLWLPPGCGILKNP